MSSQMMAVPARILPAPEVQYGKSKQSPKLASWNLIQTKFAKSGVINKWSYLIIHQGQDPYGYDRQACIAIINEFKSQCGIQGLPMPAPYVPALVNGADPHEVWLPAGPTNPAVVTDVLVKAFGSFVKNQIPIVYIFLPSADKVIYASVKYAGDVACGIQTVCSQWSKVSKERGRPQYLANVSLKWNLKMGGVNHLIGGPTFHKRIKEQKIMIVSSPPFRLFMMLIDF